MDSSVYEVDNPLHSRTPSATVYKLSHTSLDNATKMQIYRSDESNVVMQLTHNARIAARRDFAAVSLQRKKAHGNMIPVLVLKNIPDHLHSLKQ